MKKYMKPRTLLKEVKTFYERLYSDRQLEDCNILDMVEDYAHIDITRIDHA